MAKTEMTAKVKKSKSAKNKLNPRELPAWKDRKTWEKVLYVLAMLIAIAIIVAFFVDLVGGFEFLQNSFFFGALGVTFVIDAAIYWKYNRSPAIVMLVCGILLVGLTVVSACLGF